MDSSRLPRFAGLAWLSIGIALLAIGSAAGWAFVIMGAIWAIRSPEENEPPEKIRSRRVTIIVGMILALIALTAALIGRFGS